jgi:hypothetical protein
MSVLPFWSSVTSRPQTKEEELGNGVSVPVLRPWVWRARKRPLGADIHNEEVEMHMRILLVTICISGLVACSSFAHGVSIVEVSKPIHATSLSGLVAFRDSNDGIPDALVEDCTPGWKRPVSSTRTDGNGNFKLPGSKRGSVHYLRISKEGWDTLLVKVKIIRSAGVLVLNMRLST